MIKSNKKKIKKKREKKRSQKNAILPTSKTLFQQLLRAIDLKTKSNSKEDCTEIKQKTVYCLTWL